MRFFRPPNAPVARVQINPSKLRSLFAPKNNLALILGSIGGGLATGGTGFVIGALAGFAVDSYYARRLRGGR